MSNELTIVTWWWRTPGYRSEFRVEHVNILRRMVARHYPDPHRFLLVTNQDTYGLDGGIVVVPDREDFVDLPNLSRPGYPSCYRRLRLFDPVEAHSLFGARYVSLDLDMVITGDLRPLWNRSEDFVCWGGSNRSNPYNMSMMLMTAGARPLVWRNFDPERSPKLAKDAGFFGSDQAWLCYALGPDEARWSHADGVYSFANDLRHMPGAALPKGVRVVVFHGHADPWMDEVKRSHPWVQQHYR